MGGKAIQTLRGRPLSGENFCSLSEDAISGYGAELPIAVVSERPLEKETGSKTA
jgi:hypothetical protein